MFPSIHGIAAQQIDNIGIVDTASSIPAANQSGSDYLVSLNEEHEATDKIIVIINISNHATGAFGANTISIRDSVDNNIATTGQDPGELIDDHAATGNDGHRIIVFVFDGSELPDDRIFIHVHNGTADIGAVAYVAREYDVTAHVFNNSNRSDVFSLNLGSSTIAIAPDDILIAGLTLYPGTQSFIGFANLSSGPNMELNQVFSADFSGGFPAFWALLSSHNIVENTNSSYNIEANWGSAALACGCILRLSPTI